ncbi:heavy-metal-associated domain-containing protein [Hufsiella ginkgonis]|uniref:HMA domain-containing protein n=1 Tax=Hufsiella ginkgonis TaxID=2695274 RepID=A0A7K1Y1W2_9SPHI|nr:heavy-metal-associated domain-containing protein [Hufsiella ginkgonis]MXV17250.1 hypothetical protein [Hufsiella ginkgonis]
METLKFKTNIKCSGCVAAVTPGLNSLPEVESWTVDLESANKILSVSAWEGLAAGSVKEALQKAGYSAEQVD